MDMENDPFKRRIENHEPKRPLLLTKSEISKIISHAQKIQSEEQKEETLREERKEKLKAIKELSAAMAKKKELGIATKARQYAVETKAARVELDREARMEARKNRVLDQAYKRLYEETDRVKYFKAAKNYSEMLQERDMQREAKSSQRDNFEKYDAQFLLGMLRDMDDYKEEEREKIRIKEEQKKVNAENWTKQRKEALQRKDQERWEQLRDGYLVRDEDERDNKKAAGKSQMKKDQVENYKNMLDSQIKDKQVLFDVKQQLDEAENTKAKLFNDAKLNMKLEHEKIKKELDKGKNRQRETVANNMRNEDFIRKEKEKKILEKAVREAEEKGREEQAIKAVEQKEAKEAFQKFYDEEMAAKKKRAYDDKLKSYQEMRNIMNKVDELQKLEDEKLEMRNNIEKEAQHVQLHQIAKRQADEKDKEIEVIKDYMNHMRSLDDEEEMFQKYAQLEIAKCEARGVDTRAMRKAARPGIECGKGPLFKDRGHIRPRYYASVWNPEDLNHTKRSPDVQDSTKSRLGFML